MSWTIANLHLMTQHDQPYGKHPTMLRAMRSDDHW
jgi:hypothetical protein